MKAYSLHTRVEVAQSLFLQELTDMFLRGELSLKEFGERLRGYADNVEASHE